MEGHDELSDGAVPSDPADRYTGSTHTFDHDWTDPTPLHYAVVAGVGAVTDTEPEALPALYEVLDPDCLDRLFRSTSEEQRSSLEITFSFAGCDVRVTGRGEVTVRPADTVGYE